MEIKFFNKFCIITPFSPILDERENIRIFSEINSFRNIKIGINMQYVENCTFDFFDKINNFHDISLFNIQSDIFALLIAMDYDKVLNLYTTEDDFLNNKYRLINRKLKIA